MICSVGGALLRDALLLLSSFSSNLAPQISDSGACSAPQLFHLHLASSDPVELTPHLDSVFRAWCPKDASPESHASQRTRNHEGRLSSARHFVPLRARQSWVLYSRSAILRVYERRFVGGCTIRYDARMGGVKSRLLRLQTV